MSVHKYSAESCAAETNRIRLKPITADDEPLFTKMYTDPTVMSQITDALTHDEAKRAFSRALARSRMLNPKCAYFVIESKRINQAIGICAIPTFDIVGGTAEVGLMLLPDAPDRHLGTQALAALIGQVFVALPSVKEVWGQFRQGHRLASLVATRSGLRHCESVQGVHAAPGNQLTSVSRLAWTELAEEFRRPEEPPRAALQNAC